MTALGKGEPDLLSTLDLFANVLQEEKQPWETLGELAALVRDYGHADHAKVIVVQRKDGTSGLELLCRTDEDMKDFERTVVPITEVGLANWVVRHGDWLIVPEVPREWPNQGVPFPALTGWHGPLDIRAAHERVHLRSGSGRQQEASKDNEHTMLVVPLGGSKPAGALCLWRDRPKPGAPSPAPFSSPRDAEALLKVAPLLAAACQLVLQNRTLEDELKEVNELSERLHKAESLSAAYAAIAEGAGRLGAAAHALLLHRDPARPGHLYHRATWSAKGDGSEIATACRGLHVRFSSSTRKHWHQEVCTQVAQRLANSGLDALLVSPDRLLAPEEGQAPAMVAVLLDQKAAPEAPSLRLFASDRSRQAGLSFLRSAGSMLPNHLHSYANKLLDSLLEAETETDWKPDELLRKASELLREATAASATLVYSGPATALRVTSAVPENPSLIGRDIAPKTLTRKCVELKRSIRIVDTGDESDIYVQEMDRHRLDVTRSAYRWTQIRSWLVSPVLDRGRCVGVLKLLTADQDGFLGKDHEELADHMAKRAAWEVRKLNRRLQLEELNRLANDLTQVRGTALGNKIVSELEKWANRYLQPNVEIALFTRTRPDRRLIDAASPSISESQVEPLRRLSRHLESDTGFWKRGDPIDLEGGDRQRLSKALAAFPILLPGPNIIQGHLMLLHAQEFSEEERDVAREATREIGIILHGERHTRFWQEQTGRFRHAVLGPVQGLQSAARDLLNVVGDSAIEVGEAGELEELRNQILKEVELIRIWKENQRLYTQETVEIRPRYQDFKPFFERCLRRSEPLFRDNGVKLNVDWKPRGQAHLPFDEPGLDLVLSNLLENASKYAFRHTTVSAGVMITREKLEFWVEDFGHPIPADLGDRIYEVATRLDWSDPFRTIDGQGLGLAMSKAIIVAHGGTITHSSSVYLKGRQDSTEQHLVRFTVTLPTYLRGKG